MIPLDDSVSGGTFMRIGLDSNQRDLMISDDLFKVRVIFCEV